MAELSSSRSHAQPESFPIKFAQVAHRFGQWGGKTGGRSSGAVTSLRQLNSIEAMDQAKLSAPTDSFGPPDSQGRKLSWRIKSRRKYEKRKAAGLCANSGCPAAAANLHSYCSKHLHAMGAWKKQVVNTRKNEGLCTYCGKRPSFWGMFCIICRQKFIKNPLPLGARRALRLYREAEQKFELELTQAQARFEIRKLLASGNITGDYAKALRLYAGTSVSRGGRWRTYQEVGQLMHLSIERVRQLLKPSKIIIADKLAGKVPWRPVRGGSRGDKFPRPYRRKRKSVAVRKDSSRSTKLENFQLATNNSNKIVLSQ